MDENMNTVVCKESVQNRFLYDVYGRISEGGARSVGKVWDVYKIPDGCLMLVVCDAPGVQHKVILVMWPGMVLNSIALPSTTGRTENEQLSNSPSRGAANFPRSSSKNKLPQQ